MMIKKFSTLSYVAAGLLLVATALSGCAGIAKPGASDEAHLMERARAFWAARQAGDFVTAYSLEEVSKTKAQPLSGYVRKGGLIYKSAEVLGAQIHDGNATVKVHIQYVIPALSTAAAFTQDVQDPWVQIDGQWWHRQEGLTKLLKD